MIFFKKNKTIKLGLQDAALILKEDGHIDAFLPEVTSETVPEHLLTGAALINALTNPKLFEIIRETFLSDCTSPKNRVEPSNDH